MCTGVVGQWRTFRHLFRIAERQIHDNCRQPIRCLSPGLERQTRARGKVPGRMLAMRHPQRRERRTRPRHHPPVVVGSELAGKSRRLESALARRSSDAACAVQILAPWRESAQALSRRRLIRCLFPGACLPFQARGQAPDQTPTPTVAVRAGATRPAGMKKAPRRRLSRGINNLPRWTGGAGGVHPGATSARPLDGLRLRLMLQCDKRSFINR